MTLLLYCKSVVPAAGAAAGLHSRCDLSDVLEWLSWCARCIPHTVHMIILCAASCAAKDLRKLQVLVSYWTIDNQQASILNTPVNLSTVQDGFGHDVCRGAAGQ